ncbi:MAG: tRNA (adenosine(37)-N6)-threonylcarbamoyltransferase complex dimerization subunit type 1 TsaB [Janthinobacterium lividum]
MFDTCTETATLALFQGSALLEEIFLPPRAASTALLEMTRTLLQSHNRFLAQLEAVGVVSGPGSFTGVRIGLAAAKGICEAAAKPLAAVSRLEVLADAAQIPDGIVLLSAGRDQVYARELGSDERPREWLSSLGELKSLLPEKTVVVGSPELTEVLTRSGIEVRFQEISARHAITAVQRCLGWGGSDVVTADANYVRNEAAIYAKSAASR